ncbi:MAG: hypothetical protein Q8Q92_01475 [bacterium]|nr:hypothetical protein [bacterium]
MNINMKATASLFLIVSFLFIAVFGFAFSGMRLNHLGGCIVSAIDGTKCPTNIADSATHHISTLQMLTSTLVPPISNWLLLLASLFLISVSVFLFYKNLLYPKLEFLIHRIRDLVLNSLYSRQKLVSWLSLFELSPAW